jgi:hypothetical protein
MALLDNRYPDRADMGGGADVYARWGRRVIKTIIEVVGVYTLVMCFVRIVLALMGDRTGNSGRYKHWEEDDD